MTGDGIKEFFDAVEGSREEYEKYVPLCAYYSTSLLGIYELTHN